MSYMVDEVKALAKKSLGSNATSNEVNAYALGFIDSCLPLAIRARIYASAVEAQKMLNQEVSA
jgi:hypothetical protein